MVHRLAGAAGSLASFVLATVIAIAVPASAAPSGAASASTPSSRPPMLSEPFRPVLACDRRTTVGLEGCGERKVLALDRQVNADVLVVYRLEHGAPARQDLVAAQRAWISFRLLDCESQSDAYRGGSLRPVEYVDCLAVEDAARHTDLKLAYEVLTQGAARPPAFD